MFPNFATAISNDPEMMRLMINEWAEGLAGMDEETISRGFSELKATGTDFAPSLPKFIQLCGGRAEHWSSTWSGIVKKGAELGLMEDQFVYPQNFRGRVESMVEELEGKQLEKHETAI
jgi:hypothetical protein